MNAHQTKVPAGDEFGRTVWHLESITVIVDYRLDFGVVKGDLLIGMGGFRMFDHIIEHLLCDAT